MQDARSLGTFGWMAINLLLLAILAAMTFGFSVLFYFAAVLAPLALLVIVVLTRGGPALGADERPNP